MSTISNITEENLKHFYLERKLPAREVAKIFNCCTSTILKRLREFKIPIRLQNRKSTKYIDKILDRGTLIELYVNQIMTGREIAKTFGVSLKSVYRRLGQYGIPRFGRTYDRVLIPENELTKLYLEDLLSATEIARKYNCVPHVVLNRLDKFKIPRRTRSEAGMIRYKHHKYVATYDDNLRISDYLKEVIQGELLGDGCMAKSSESSTRAYFSYQTSKRDYCEYLRNLINKEIPCREVKPFKNRNAYIFQSQRQKVFHDLYNKWYPHGKKVVPPDLKLTPTVVKHWYIGDGYLGKSEIRLYSCSFSRKDVLFLANQLVDILEINARINDSLKNKRTGKPYPTIVVTGKENLTRFLNYIGNCPVKSYQHKWDLSKFYVQAS